EVGGDVVEHGQRLLGVVGLADDLEVGLGLERHGEALAHERVVVDQEDAGLHRAAGGGSERRGRVQVTTVPPLVPGRISRAPPITRARWCMIRMPMPRLSSGRAGALTSGVKAP